MNADYGESKGTNDAFTSMWTEFAQKMSQAGFAFKPDAIPPEAARQMRSAMFQAMTAYCDEYMRSPQFLEAMKQSMDSALTLRSQLNTWLTRMHHDLQSGTKEDVEMLAARVVQMEKQTLGRLDALAERLDQLGEHLTSLNGHRQKNKLPDETPRQKPRPKSQKRRKGRPRR
jgi:hypothetical protein